MMNASAATLNVIIISDPTGQDPNGAAAGSMSYDDNMFQSTFLFSPSDKFAVLSGGNDITSGGTQNDTLRLNMVVNAINLLKSNATAQSAAALALSGAYSGQRLVVGGPNTGAAIAGTSGNWLIEVSNDSTITVTPLAAGQEGVLPPGTKGAVLHLLHTPGNPMPDNTTAVGLAASEMIGEEIRDGYPSTQIMGDVFKMVASQSGEKYGGGAINLDSSISTADMFTPTEINQKGFPMDQPYSKVDPTSGWSIGYPQAESYSTSPINGQPLETVYAYDALKNAITVEPSNATVYTYGTDAPGISETTDEVVTYSVSKHGFDATAIAGDINSAINSGLLVGVNYVEPKDINVKADTKEVGVYYVPVPNHKTAPTWNLPISSSVLEVLGDLQTAIGFVLVVLVIFRRSLITNFFKKQRKIVRRRSNSE